MSTLNKLEQRARLYQKIRAFFHARDYLEVDTPLLSISTNTDVHIQSIAARVCGNTQYLQTSPEFAMKRLLAEGSGSIFQICHAFRDEEHGRWHRSEFAMLEWYSLGFDYVALMDQLEQLIIELFEESIIFRRIGYFDAFNEVLGIDLKTVTLPELISVIKQNIAGMSDVELSKNDCMDLLISQVIAKQFKGFTFIYDYPSSQASLARIKADDCNVAERFELFYNDMELANGFTELTDAKEQRQRFLLDNQFRSEQGLEIYPLDEAFLNALEQGLPECAGVAVGLDRLLMLKMQIDDIFQVTMRSS